MGHMVKHKMRCAAHISDGAPCTCGADPDHSIQTTPHVDGHSHDASCLAAQGVGAECTCAECGCGEARNLDASKAEPGHLQTIKERYAYLAHRIAAKKAVGWDTHYDEREHAALEWAITQL